MNVVERLLWESVGLTRLREHRLGANFSVVLITPRFVASRHVVALVLDASGTERLVVKFPRRRGDDAGIRREARVLTDVVTRGGTGLGVPQVVGMFERSGTGFLVETALHGRALDPHEAGRAFEPAVAAGVAFVESLPRVAVSDVTDDWYAVMLEEAFDALRRLGGPTLTALVERTEALLEPLRRVDLPRVVQHGDLSHPNLLLGPSGGLQVLDWERAVVRGLPGVDLVFYLEYLGESRRLAFERAEQVAAFEDTFWSPDAWGTRILRGHLERCGVPPELSPLVVLACWATSAATLVERILGSGDEGAGRVGGVDELAGALASDRDVLLWRRAVELLESVPPGSVTSSGRVVYST